MTELVFRGTFETQNWKSFMEGLDNLFKETDTKFQGQVLQFEIDTYTSYEEVKEEKINELISESDADSSGNEGNKN